MSSSSISERTAAIGARISCAISAAVHASDGIGRAEATGSGIGRVSAIESSRRAMGREDRHIGKAPLQQRSIALGRPALPTPRAPAAPPIDRGSASP
ncbi:MAG: hypothetical protein JSR59_14360 [Proteobacteria bacterium]|nr:hypothetical protein [Pseudomonadota bacterium]